jgi:outer membrane protein OmpA-like peptidoglycan-associated protein
MWSQFLRRQELSMIRSLLLVFATLALFSMQAFADEPDASDCMDHPLFNRFPGFYIQRCTVNDFAAHKFLVARKEVVVEGRYTEIMYYKNESAKTPNPLQVHRNFENAVKKIGGSLTSKSEEGESYLKLIKDGTEVWVNVSMNIAEQYMVRIVEKSAMQQVIEADAAALGAGIKAEGRIAVYGIQFDTGKAEIKPASEPALVEIAKLLKTQPALKLHVVGHTDNVAGIDLNLKLSKARAEAVVQALTSRHKIAAARLIPHGVGPVSPVASNDDETGRAKNRRVELVKQ